MGLVTLRGRVTDIIVAVMAEGHIDDTSISKVLQILQFPIKGDAILNAEHNALAACLLILPKIGRGTGNAHIVAVIIGDSLDLVEDVISISRGILRRLWQIGHHDRSIKPALSHLRQIDENAWVALVESDALREKHGCVAVGVESEHTVVNTMGLPIALSLAYQPLEEWQPTHHTLWMPLYTDDGFELRTLHRLDDAIGGCSNDSEFITRITNGLMMEGVNRNLRSVE